MPQTLRPPSMLVPQRGASPEGHQDLLPCHVQGWSIEWDPRGPASGCFKHGIADMLTDDRRETQIVLLDEHRQRRPRVNRTNVQPRQKTHGLGHTSGLFFMLRSLAVHAPRILFVSSGGFQGKSAATTGPTRSTAIKSLCDTRSGGLCAAARGELSTWTLPWALRSSGYVVNWRRTALKGAGADVEAWRWGFNHHLWQGRRAVSLYDASAGEIWGQPLNPQSWTGLVASCGRRSQSVAAVCVTWASDVAAPVRPPGRQSLPGSEEGSPRPNLGSAATHDGHWSVASALWSGGWHCSGPETARSCGSGPDWLFRG